METYTWAAFAIIAVAGLIIGSFLNVIIYRFDELKTIVNTRSRCPHCQKQLAWYDLFPLFSFILLSGKCRYCKKEISIQYPLVELGTALIFVVLYWKFSFSLIFLALIVISTLLIIAFAYDILHLEIADWLVWFSVFVWIIYLAFGYFIFHNSLSFILNSLYGGLALGGFLGAIVVLSKEKWMGTGDISLGFLIGLMAGWPNVILTTLLSFIFGGVLGLILIGAKNKTLKDKVPFAPFLILSLWITLFFGSEIINWYLGGL